MRFVLILVAANYHQAIVCGGGRRNSGGRKEGEEWPSTYEGDLDPVMSKSTLLEPRYKVL